MEPIWMGLTGLSLGSAVRSVAKQAAEPFEAVLRSIQDSEEGQSQRSSQAPLDPKHDPHMRLLGELLTGEPQLEDSLDINLADIRYRADSLQQDLEAKIAEALQAAGIEIEGNVQLKISPVDGRLEITGDSPQRGAIEQALSTDPSMAADFRQLSALRALISAAEQNSEFEDAYELDPFQAVNDFQALFNSEQQVTLTGSGLLAELRFA